MSNPEKTQIIVDAFNAQFGHLQAENQHLREQGRQVEAELVEAKRRTLLLLATLTLAFEEVESNADMFNQLGYPMLHKSTMMVANKLRSLIDAASKETS